MLEEVVTQCQHKNQTISELKTIDKKKDVRIIVCNDCGHKMVKIDKPRKVNNCLIQ